METILRVTFAMVSATCLLACDGDGAPCTGAGCDAPRADGGPMQGEEDAGEDPEDPEGDAGTLPVGVCPEPPTAPVVPEGTELDTAHNPDITTRIHLNQLGFETAQAKRAVVTSSGPLESFQVVRDGDEAVVLVGKLKFARFEAFGPRDPHAVADFSALRTPGTYRLVVNGKPSEPFEVGTQLLGKKLLAALVSYFRNSRADAPAVLEADANMPIEGAAEARADVQGGYFDASGDISKYLSHLAFSNFLTPQQTPLVAWALAYAKEEGGALLEADGLEKALEEEALWAADYLVRVQSSEGFFYTNVFDVWSGDLARRSICSIESGTGTKGSNYRAAFREGGGMAIAALARVGSWGKDGAFAASRYLEVARSGYTHLVATKGSYGDDGKENIIDDYSALLAATELYRADQDEAFLADARTRAAALVARLSPAGYFVADGGTRPFWHASDAGLPVVALVRYAATETDAERRDAALGAIATHLTYLARVTAEVPNPFGYARQHVNTGGMVKSSFFIPHDNETGYWWQGESARLASLAAAAYLGQAATRPGDCRETDAMTSGLARAQLDWILGTNPLDISFVHGFGKNNPAPYCGEKQPYHGTLLGGIANGITGSGVDGSGFKWLMGGGVPCWDEWRWVEQWLPHSAWMLVAVVSEANAVRPR
jgi:hypothetical protein